MSEALGDIVKTLGDSHVQVMSCAIELVEVWEHPRTTRSQAESAEDALISAVKKWRKVCNYQPELVRR